MLPPTPTQHYLVLIRFQRKISFVASFTISRRLEKYYAFNSTQRNVTSESESPSWSAAPPTSPSASFGKLLNNSSSKEEAECHFSTQVVCSRLVSGVRAELRRLRLQRRLTFSSPFSRLL